MTTESKPIDSYTEERRSSIEKDKAKLDLVPGANDARNEFFDDFVGRGEEWRKEMDKKLLRKVDIRLLPCLVVSCVDSRRYLHLSVAANHLHTNA